uniref:Uncharacterized protein n=1 Tax=Arundo donax TaxID=35708 RepID=A0A0A8YT94_ARUDO
MAAIISNNDVQILQYLCCFPFEFCSIQFDIVVFDSTSFFHNSQGCQLVIYAHVIVLFL